MWGATVIRVSAPTPTECFGVVRGLHRITQVSRRTPISLPFVKGKDLPRPVDQVLKPETLWESAARYANGDPTPVWGVA